MLLQEEILTTLHSLAFSLSIRELIFSFNSSKLSV
nr:MAG TPA: hypothetical protein [Caudoviricetes sp.]